MKKRKQLKDNRGCLQKYLNGQSGQFTVRAKGKQNLKESKEFHPPKSSNSPKITCGLLKCPKSSVPQCPKALCDQ